MRPWMTIGVLALGTATASLFGQSSYADSNWQRECTSALAAPLTPPAVEVSSAASRCDESDLYYGITGKRDYSAALECGWYERARPQAPDGNMFYGPGVLAMLYANGEAGPHNYDLAIRLVCEQQGISQAEMALRVGHLEAIRAGKTEAGVFDLCDDITSGLSMGSCMRIETRRADARREQEIAAAVAKLSPEAKPAFERLRQAEAAFEEARSANEIDLSGTARGVFALEEEKKLRDQFLTNLLRFAGGDVPATSATQLAAADRTLNTTYQEIQRLPQEHWQYGTVRPEGIRETERAWVALADAWSEFAAQAYPNLEASTVRAQIVRLRLHQLRSLAPHIQE